MRILFIGGGNMATALIGGLLRQGFGHSDIRVVEVSPEARQRLQRDLGVEVSGQADAPIGEDVVVLAVKPQQLREVATGLQPLLRGQLTISIAAGIRTTDLSRWLGGHGRIVRAMPNTPALLGAGISGLFAAPGSGAADRTVAQQILGAVGKVVWLERETQMDAVTAVSGSGPAYVFYFIEALQQAAQDSGFSEAQARELAVETFLGAAKLAAGSSDPAAVLRERVTSRGGTTERALKQMEADDIKRRVVEAIRAAEVRSRELGDELGRN
jgi:pyrroline-5-carboxylate reductase